MWQEVAPRTSDSSPEERGRRTLLLDLETLGASVRSRKGAPLTNKRTTQRSSGENSPNIAADTVNLFFSAPADDASMASGTFLPNRNDPVIGRDNRIAEIDGICTGEAGSRILLHGVSGIGRKSVAFAVADRASAQYDTVVHVSCLSGAGEPPLSALAICQRLLTRLNQSPPLHPHAVEAMQALLGARNTLLVLTDVETAAQIDGMALPTSVDLIATSQSRLSDLHDIRKFHIGPLETGVAELVLRYYLSDEASSGVGDDDLRALARVCFGHPALLKVSAGVVGSGLYDGPRALAEALAKRPSSWREADLGKEIGESIAQILYRLPERSQQLLGRIGRLPFLELARDDLSVVMGGK